MLYDLDHAVLSSQKRRGKTYTCTDHIVVCCGLTWIFIGVHDNDGIGKLVALGSVVHKILHFSFHLVCSYVSLVQTECKSNSLVLN